MTDPRHRPHQDTTPLPDTGGPTLTVRPARPDDRESIWPLAVALATSTDLTRPAFERTFDTLLDAPHELFLVAETRGAKIIGYAMAFAHRAFHSDGPVVWLEEIIVQPESRGLGVGRALMDAVEHWAYAEMDATYMALATRRAATFYETLGYHASATYFRRDLTAADLHEKCIKERCTEGSALRTSQSEALPGPVARRRRTLPPGNDQPPPGERS